MANPFLGPVFPAHLVRTISRDELRERLNVSSSLRLVMCMPEWEFRRKHIPKSLHFSTPSEMLASLAPSDEVVVYCTNVACLASQAAYRLLVEHGFSNVKRYAGGVQDWGEAGLPLEGDSLGEQAHERP